MLQRITHDDDLKDSLCVFLGTSHIGKVVIYTGIGGHRELIGKQDVELLAQERNVDGPVADSDKVKTYSQTEEEVGMRLPLLPQMSGESSVLDQTGAVE